MTPELRADFPVLARRLDGKPITYLDSAATALKPRSVLEAEAEYGRSYTANVHRGRHALSEEASEAFDRARRRVARHLGADPSSVVFVRNTTEGLNLVASGLPLGKQDVTLVPLAEHHSNLLPWMRRTRAVLMDWDPLVPLDPGAVAEAMDRERPRILALAHASNVTGVVHPLREICRAARERGILTVIDAAQSAAHLPLDVGALGCDFLAFSAHKVLGPTGVGVLWGRPELLERLEPLLLGGGTVERVTTTGYQLKGVPHRLEAGTPAIGPAVGLAAALDYLENVGFEALAAHERVLAAVLERELEGLPGARVLMARSEPRLALASVAPLSDRVSPDHLARALSDSFQIMVRSGYHCAHPTFDRLGLPYGSVRASAYVYNLPEELERFARSLRLLLEKLVARH